MREDDLRALVRPPLAPAVRTDIVPRPLVRDELFDVPDSRAVARPPFLPAAFFCAVVDSSIGVTDAQKGHASVMSVVYLFSNVRRNLSVRVAR